MKTNEKKKNPAKKSWGQWAGYIVALVIGLVGGGWIGAQFGKLMAGSDSVGGVLLIYAACMLGLYAGYVIQIAVHEAGHLIAGLMSGYRFVSYRIFSFMWVKQEERIRLRRFSLAGTGGQCLMSPPDLVDGKIPVALYNMGGAIMNVLASLLCWGLWYLCRPVPYLAVFFLTMTAFGVIFALSNGIPLRLGQIDNDGYNALSLGKNPAALRSFWVQLKANEQQMRGVRLKNMPEEWFTLPTAEDMKNSMSSVIAVLAANRLMDEARFDEADALMRRLEEGGYNIIGMYRSLMACDRLYIELIGQNRAEAVGALYTPALAKFMKAMKTFPSALRTRYALALIHEKDAAQAGKLCAAFDRMAANHPEPGTIEAERTLMALADERAAAQK